MKEVQFTRIEKVLSYIEANLSEPLSVESLADLSSWSRWQFQRVFSHATGLSIAQYVRELRLSKAAESLITSKDRHIDIALAYGFSSEVSFNRSFSQMFGCTPGEYRKRGIVSGVRTPITITKQLNQIYDFDPRFLQIRLETKPAFEVVGVKGPINGLLSDKPDFLTQVPRIWDDLKSALSVESAKGLSALGVIDTTKITDSSDSLIYWAGTESTHELNETTLFRLLIPEQRYAVIPHKGYVSELHKTLSWVLHCWLPDSEYRGINGFELEVYGQDYDPFSAEAYMEYWLPISS